MINKLLFLHHGGETIAGPVAPSEGGVTAGIVFILVVLALIIGLWFYFTRKKKI